MDDPLPGETEGNVVHAMSYRTSKPKNANGTALVLVASGIFAAGHIVAEFLAGGIYVFHQLSQSTVTHSIAVRIEEDFFTSLQIDGIYMVFNAIIFAVAMGIIRSGSPRICAMSRRQVWARALIASLIYSACDWAIAGPPLWTESFQQDLGMALLLELVCAWILGMLALAVPS